MNNSPLHEAVISQDLVTVMNLIATNADVHACNDNGQTPLHVARDYKIAQLLLSAGADVDARDNHDCTPLIYAIVLRTVPVFQLLLQAGADINVKTKNVDETPLHYALSGMEKLSFIIIEELLVVGAFVNAQTKEGLTPLHYFYLGEQKNGVKSHQRIEKILVEFGVDFQLRDHKGRAPLDYAQNLNSQRINQIKKLLR